MWILPLVGYIGAFVGFCFLTLAIASGLYYLSELVEEHTVMAKRFLSRLIYGIIVLQLFLCIIDGFPFWQTALGIFSHVIYLGNMRRFPVVQLTDPLFISSCILVLVNHYIWFRYFSHYQQRYYKNMSSYYDSPSDIPTFTEIASYFGLCVWLVPFALFVSLSASDNVLPTMGSGQSSSVGMDDEGKGKKSQGMAKALVDNALSAFGGLTSATGLKRPEDRL